MHVIRLRAAWTHEGGGVSVRRFNKPTGLEGGERVWLVWDGAVEAAELNGEPLDVTPTRHDVTERLKLANEMRLVGSCRDVLATVQLEIDESAGI
jgi:hypothetical protein